MADIRDRTNLIGLPDAFWASNNSPKCLAILFFGRDFLGSMRLKTHYHIL
ncbi:MAG: hypothetical protein PUP90_00170 [Nostoc sp. S4]|nr:hypothetical protein [Nostoc sp. S4]